MYNAKSLLGWRLRNVFHALKKYMLISVILLFLALLTKCTNEMAYVFYMLHYDLFDQAIGGLFTKS